MLLFRKNTRDLWLNLKKIGLIVFLITIVVAVYCGGRLYLVNLQSNVNALSLQLNPPDARITFITTRICDNCTSDARPLSVFANSEVVAAYSLRLVEPARITVRGKTHQALLSFHDLRNSGSVNLIATIPEAELTEDDVPGRQVLINERFAILNNINPGETLTINKSGERHEFVIKGKFVSPEYPVSSMEPEALMAASGYLAIVVIPDTGSPVDSSYYNQVDLILNKERPVGEALRQLKQEMERDGFQLLEVRTKGEQAGLQTNKSPDELLSWGLLCFGGISGLIVILTFGLIAYRMLFGNRVELATLRGLGVTWPTLIWHQGLSGLLVGAVATAFGLMLAPTVARALAKSFHLEYGFPQLFIRLHPAVFVEGTSIALAVSVFGSVLPLFYFIGKTPKCIELNGESEYTSKPTRRSSPFGLIHAAFADSLNHLRRRSYLTLSSIVGLVFCVCLAHGLLTIVQKLTANSRSLFAATGWDVELKLPPIAMSNQDSDAQNVEGRTTTILKSLDHVEAVEVLALGRVEVLSQRGSVFQPVVATQSGNAKPELLPVKQGRQLDGRELGQIILPENTARVLSVSAGDYVQLINKAGSSRVEVAGILDRTVLQVAYVPSAFFNTLFPTPVDPSIALVRLNNTQQGLAQIEQQIPNLTYAFAKEDIQRAALTNLKNVRWVLLILLVETLLLAALILLGSSTIKVMQRRDRLTFETTVSGSREFVGLALENMLMVTTALVISPVLIFTLIWKFQRGLAESMGYADLRFEMSEYLLVASLIGALAIAATIISHTLAGNVGAEK